MMIRVISIDTGFLEVYESPESVANLSMDLGRVPENQDKA